MNVYLYLRHFPPHRAPPGGMGRTTHGLASGLAACGATVTVLCEGPETCVVPSPRGYTIRCFATRGSERSFSIADGLRRFVQNEADEGIAVLNGVFQPAGYTMSRLLSKRGMTYVSHPVGVYRPELFRRNRHLKVPYWYLFERRMLRAAAAIQVNDIRHAAWLRRRGIDRPTIEVPLGVFPEDASPEASLRWRANGVPALLFFGRIDTYTKGLDILLDAFAEIVRDVDATLTIQGPRAGRDRGLEARAASLALSQKVRFLGPHHETPSVSRLAEHDIVCLPSRHEAFGLSAVEGMLAARVLLVSERAGIAPHVEASGCGVLVSPDRESVRVGLLQLLARRSEWPEMGLRGRQYAIEHLAWTRVAGGALDHYRRLAGGEKS
jgi:glycosyltransferase involved in cell wall biosynthesis